MVAAGCSAPTSSTGSEHGGGRTVGTGAGENAGGGDDWPMYGFDAGNTGFNPDAAGPRGAVAERWRRGLSGVTSTSAPAVADGAVFVADRTEALRFEASAERAVWRTDTGSFNSFHTPAVGGDAVYVAGRDRGVGLTEAVSRDLTAPGTVTALDADDGSVRWARSTHVSSSPVVHGGRVHYAAMRPDGRAAVRALDAERGADRWRTDVGGGEAVTRVTAPAIAGGRVYATVATARGGRVLALDASDGTRRWTVETDAGVHASPAVADGRVYVASHDGTVSALATADGEELWTARPLATRVVGVPPAVAYGTVFVGGYEGVAAVDADDGSTDWTASMALGAAPMAVADETLYTGGDEVRATATADGTLRWTFEHEGYSSAYAGPAVAAGTVYVTDCVKQRPVSLYDQAVVALGEE